MEKELVVTNPTIICHSFVAPPPRSHSAIVECIVLYTPPLNRFVRMAFLAYLRHCLF